MAWNFVALIVDFASHELEAGVATVTGFGTGTGLEGSHVGIDEWCSEVELSSGLGGCCGGLLGVRM